MSTLLCYAVNPASGVKQPVYEGWNWPAFFFGIFWCMAKGLWKHAAILFILLLFTAWIPVLGWLVAIGSWFFLGANGNDIVANNLLERGFVTEGSGAMHGEETRTRAVRITSGAPPEDKTQDDMFGSLEKLHGLYKSGALTEEEYAVQKARILKS
ncbi:SHOCT domain-containing protein [Qipengyuania nanhaisediminis]|uniref:SHOCT domain-containing protein n=1 Tax=Qipengyuania nanhaisediminis TaxID=604088 RepID=A0A1I5L9W8_9SPHN|nr:SHOCT domain-containing protein [Qipengyuania nanhaisediminis]SFO94159.1 Protein of unknown function [Qipengyuania nanhaisediminis]